MVIPLFITVFCGMSNKRVILCEKMAKMLVACVSTIVMFQKISVVARVKNIAEHSKT